MKKLTKILMSALCVTAICGGTAALGACGSKKESITVSGSSSTFIPQGYGDSAASFAVLIRVC